MKKRILFVLTALIVLCAVVFPALPTARAATYSGKCGSNLTWSLDTGTGALKIEGSGEMWALAGGGGFEEFGDVIKTITISGATNIMPNFCYLPALETVNIKSGAVTIENQAFQGCKKLKTVFLPNGLVTIGKMAFYDCIGLKTISIPSSVTSIGERAFEGCSSLENVSIPSSVKSIGKEAYCSCSSLTTLSLASGLEQIGESAFAGCGNIQKLTVPSTVSSISSKAFYACEKLKRVTIEEGVTSIGENAFCWCSRLKSVSIPNTVKKIEFRAFFQCFDLKKVFIPGSVAHIDSESFGWYKNGNEYHKVPGFTIYGTAGTAAQRYAQDNEFSFIQNVVFYDVFENDYFADSVAWAVSIGVTGGTDATHFSPNVTCTREQIVTFLYAAAGRPGHSMTDNPFRDVKKSKYYYDAVMWAVENGVTGGVGDGKFGVGVSCTREQAVTFLWKAKGSPEPAGTECSFADVKPRQYYYKAVLWAVENGVTGGVGGGKFGVGQTCTRAQIVTFLNAAFA